MRYIVLKYRKQLIRRITGIVLPLMMIFLVLFYPAQVFAAAFGENAEMTDSDDTYDSPSMILIEANSGTVLYEKNADSVMQPASVTKIMTLLLIFEAMDAGEYGLDDIVTISEHAASMGGSQCFFEQGEQQIVEDMIKCIIIASGNDAAVAMAEFTSGSEEAFVELMNNRANELGMENTHFINACGLDAEGHVTTSRDIAIMSRELIVNHPEVLDYSGIWTDSIVHTTARGSSQFDLANTNKFLKMYTGATGLKTGYTSSAKYCMSATAEREGVSLIAVIMGAETKDIRNQEACRLLDYGFAMCSKYTDEEVLSEDTLAVSGGTKERVKITSAEVFESVLFKGEQSDSVTKELVLFQDLKAPVKADESIGYVEYSIGDRIIGAVEVKTAENVNEMTYNYALKKIFAKAFLLRTWQ
jgi:D-alanyl-D-alanine carboxypeptidase (penicillin-binding protein 5/6)